VEDGAPPSEGEYRKIEQDGVTLWVPSFLKFRNEMIEVVQRGFLWSAYLMVTSVEAGSGSFCADCSDCGE
ncbi:MAG: hypothetical protein AB7U27_06985, partial [Aminobacteriaceae bacterium]